MSKSKTSKRGMARAARKFAAAVILSTAIIATVTVAIAVIMEMVAKECSVPNYENDTWPESWKRASPDASAIAEAIATPPTHLKNPAFICLYHWQGLAGGVLAIVAAAIGAGAIYTQTTRMEKATIK